jgi:hypothetical protein
MILADVVHQDGVTGKFSILGTYSAIGVLSFPWTHPYVAVYLSLTDGRGETPMRMRLIDAEEERPPVFESETVLNFTDPTEVIELRFIHPAVVFPEPGEYRLQLFGAGEFLRECRVLVLPMQQPDEEDAGEAEEDSA